MRARKIKLPLTLESIQFLLGGRRPFTLGELSLSFAEPPREVEELLRVGVALGALKYFPESRKQEGRYVLNELHSDNRAKRREPVKLEGDFRYDLFVHARLSKST